MTRTRYGAPRARRQSQQNTHEKWMRLALNLALKGHYKTHPNPIVGACVISKGKVIGRGWHARFGGAHAEIPALKQAGKAARGADLYVTLEPCSSWGKTPPCVDQIIHSGVRTVIYALRDPNPKHRGRAKQLLRKAGIQVLDGVLAGEARKQNKFFLKWIQTGSPYVTLKMAQTLDGKIATSAGASKWISSEASRNYVQKLRASHAAVLVGKNTLLKDNPRLNVRSRRLVSACRPAYPWRIILDPEGQIPAGAKVFSGKQAVVLVVAPRALKRAAKIHRSKTVTLLPIREIRGKLDFKELLAKLGSLGISSLLVEGGGETAWSFLANKQVDRLIWIIAPKIFGGRTAKTSVEGSGVQTPLSAFRLKQQTTFSLGSDWIVEGEL